MQIELILLHMKYISLKTVCVYNGKFSRSIAMHICNPKLVNTVTHSM